jgi:hypothetical protein
LDFFVIYDAQGGPLNERITLKGQFDKTASRPVMAPYWKGFADPVRFGGKPIRNPREHLKWYLLRTPNEPPRTVTINNVFGPVILAIGDADHLLVPTLAELIQGARLGGLSRQKTPSKAPAPPGDHYKAYLVRDAKPVGKKVALEDPFTGAKGTAVVGRPLYFCVPVEKRHGDRTYPIQNPEDHLTIYELRPSLESKPVNVATQDQFVVARFKLGPITLLCVPTLKRSWKSG